MVQAGVYAVTTEKRPCQTTALSAIRESMVLPDGEIMTLSGAISTDTMIGVRLARTTEESQIPMSNKRIPAANESEASTQKLAVLIDADNAQPAVIEALLAEVARFGEATVRRIYGDFTASTSTQWKQVLNRYAINPIQQFAYTTGKNATDSRLIIDAMDLLHKGTVNGFCLVSSDSDFTGLASRIREEGLAVYGFGEHKTPEAFRNSCNKFVFTENLRPHTASAHVQPHIKPKSSCAKNAPPQEPTPNAHQEKIVKDLPILLLRKAFELTSNEAGWVHLGNLGHYLNRGHMDSRN
jgi:hypothetical protein